MGALASLEQREEVRRSLKALLSARHRSCSATRSTSTSSAPTPSAARSCRRCCCGPTTPSRRRAARGRGVRPGQHADRLPRRRRRHRARRARPGQPGRLGRHRRRRLRPRGRARRRAVARPAAGARPRRRAPSPPGTARRCRCSCTAARAAPAAARSSAACAACCTTCSAPRCRRSPRDARARSPAAGCRGAERSDDGGHPFRKSLAELRHRRHRRRRPAHRHRWTTSTHFAEFTGDTFYAHTDDEAAAAQPVLRRPGRARLPVVSFAAGLFVDPDSGPGARQLRHRQPALPHAGLPGRRADGHADLQADHAARRRRVRRGALGRRGHQAGRRGRSPQYDVLTMVAKEWPTDVTDDRSSSTSTPRSRTTGASSRATGCPTPTARR